ncbi:glycosyltransferase family 1 protein [Schizophyllum amplum]|uniref:Glycosyltransferase family 1 protein n=1 Tax=Schizophyllum amplum TaxID=97359 RepID=A0A550C4T5_9AGAR|nr:glycosyltransferase family 1 protein [Auriculariopsis ampla]
MSQTPYYMRDPDAEALPPYTRSDGGDGGSDKDSKYMSVNGTNINYSEWKAIGKGLASAARVAPDGRIGVTLDLKESLPDLPEDHAYQVAEFGVDEGNWQSYPKMSIVIMIVGSRGDVQPFVALGKSLARDGHRVRIASHETFRGFVNDHGLEFFDVGGDPKELMSYMVKNPGLMPGMESLTNGDIGKKRKMMDGCWKACNSPDQKTGRPFIADAIISNPPAFAHVHCAEAMGIPLLLSFTMPWCATGAFPHPLVDISFSNAGERLTNYISYALADILTWQGMGDIVNKFRNRALGLPSLSVRSGPGLSERLRVPWTYCMSPALVPKPTDWSNHIDVVGFYFLDLATSYTPPDDLAAFLSAGPAPVYIGFGSVVVDDPAEMSRIIFEGTKRAGVRALVSAGWGGLGGVDVPSNIFILGNIPHDWLFSNGRVAAVVHHGGAGTTAIGLANGLPTVVVPFFGDQGFWGDMIHRAGAGPEPIPHKKLTADALTDALTFAVSAPAKTAAAEMGRQIASEDGVRAGADSFYRHLPLLNMRCDLCPDRLAIWWSTDLCMKLSSLAAQTLVDAHRIKMDSLDLHRPKEYESRKTYTDPLSGCAGGVFWTVLHHYAAVAQIFTSPMQGIVKTTTAIPQGVYKIVIGVHEGFANLPKLYGSQVRKPKQVKGFMSGVKEGGKGLFYGYYDGITGLVTEPLEGAKKEGFMGAVKGAGRSFVNATMKPAAGIVGVVGLPLQGMFRAMQSPHSERQERQQRATRQAEGIEAARASSPREREEILKRFGTMKAGTDERRRRITAMAEEQMREVEKEADAVERPVYDTDSNSLADVKSGVGMGSSRNLNAPATNEVDHDKAYEEDLAYALQLSQQQQAHTGDTTKMELSAKASVVDEPTANADEEAFQRDMDLATRLSLAEQAGYERGMMHAASGQR